MKPILFEIFGWKAPSYAVLMALGFVVALMTIWALVPRQPTAGLSGITAGVRQAFALLVSFLGSTKLGQKLYPIPDHPDDQGLPVSRARSMDLYLVMLISALLGSKFGHVLFEAEGHVGSDGQKIETLWQLLQDDPWHWARLGEAGYVWYGGMIGALLVAIYYFKTRPQLKAALYSDVFAPAIMTGAAVGRFGCFLAGCCYGQPTDSPWGVLFPHLHSLGPVHPTQLYDTFIAAALGSFLMLRFKKRRFDGENIAWLLMLYPALRATTEVFRGDPERGAFLILSTSQWLSIPLFAAGAYLYLSRKDKGPCTTLLVEPETAATQQAEAQA